MFKFSSCQLADVCSNRRTKNTLEQSWELWVCCQLEGESVSAQLHVFWLSAPVPLPHLCNPVPPACWENITLKGTHRATNSNSHPCHMTMHLYYWANYIRQHQVLSTCPFFVVVSQPYLPASKKSKFRKATDCLLAPVNGKRPAFPAQRANNLFPGIWFLLEEPLFHSLLSLWYWWGNIIDRSILKDL